MTDRVMITQGEGYEWAIAVADETGAPKIISGGTPAASAEKLRAGGELVDADASLADSVTIHAGLADGVLSVGLWRVQTWLTLDGKRRMLDEFEIEVREANG